MHAVVIREFGSKQKRLERAVPLCRYESARERKPGNRERRTLALTRCHAPYNPSIRIKVDYD
jgi:hypothetical protein